MDRDIVKAHLTYFTNYSYFTNVDRCFTADEEMVTLVLSRDVEQWKYIDESLKNNEKFLAKILTIIPSIYKFFPLSKRCIKEVALKAMKYGKNLCLASEALKNDKDVVMEAVSNSGQSIRYASKELRQDKKVIEAALKNDPYGVSYILSKLTEEERLIGTWRFQFKVGEHSQYNHDLMIFDLVLNADYSYLLFNQDISEDYDAGYPRTRDRKTTGKWKIGIYNSVDALYLDENALMSIAMLNECANYHNRNCEQFNEEAERHTYSHDRKTFSFADGVWSERLF
ncbi:predicted protein [Naegleria gruberi]|uniref:Predicted protein n=1 Tax=Naegleria gruberi TaxID=5762 RepID=D2UYS7_NAEGR|nr:uncharacterized protein NAEGRDRAFT_45251 [Naegleria gruberi]EFC50532.1 predicted protein [Naegleria gruberi]|eukprot:XP_002683276.1 predicted protein [Naegleria gruberi strain NEG-M]